MNCTNRIKRRAAAVSLGLALVWMHGCHRDDVPHDDVAAEGVGARDSAWAVSVAAKEMSRHGSGPSLVVGEFERDGDDYVVTFHAGREQVGGGGVVRVRPDGRAVIEAQTQ